MSLLGACCAFAICATGPLATEIVLNGGYARRGWKGGLDVTLLVMSVLMGAWGTISAVWGQIDQI